MRWVYLSPHFDDAVLSCGGQIWEQAQAGQVVEIWTVCGGAPAQGQALSAFAQALHARWAFGPGAPEAVLARRAEDEGAASRLRAHLRAWDLPDCIYRRLPDGPAGAPGSWLVNGEDDLWQDVHPLEEGVLERMAAWFLRDLSAADCLVSPLTLGNHVDHRLVRAAARRAAQQAGCRLWYYSDYPYAVRGAAEVQARTGADWQEVCLEISAEGLRAWQEAVACYTSQISTFWTGLDAMRAAIEDYWRAGGGACLWAPHEHLPSKEECNRRFSKKNAAQNQDSI
jgi:LmbE family N-acetylglucosaminyl deacetylase